MEQVVKINNHSFFDAVKESLAVGNQVKFRVVGNSMRPFLREGDQVVIQEANQHDYQRGAILLAHWKDGYVLHRLVRYRGDFVWLAGDNNLVQLEQIPVEQIIAVVVCAYRGEKRVLKQSFWVRIVGMLWFHARPLRIVGAKLIRLIRKEYV